MATFDTSLAYIQASGLSDDDQGLALAYLGANREQEIYTLANNPNAAVRLALFRSWAAERRQQQAQGPGRTHFDSVVDGYIEDFIHHVSDYCLHLFDRRNKGLKQN
eukprot:TRINITY_DN576_c0_g1_i3.p1 TRINITY_DN576_c0_g1~~TRINITY_DN576_c0_g1_i3.p1  ORF type:complete len:106 (-),score=8.59 TRINITY_DN576_c0_g1_i3:255-572(-)